MTAIPAVGRAPRNSAPWYLVLPVVACAAGAVLPLVCLLIEAAKSDPDALGQTVFRLRNLALLGKTLLLTCVVLVASTLLALPASWLTTRTDLPGRRLFTVLAVLPLAVPGYLLAYTLLAMGGDFGSIARLTGVSAPRLSGFWGAAIALTIYNTPYLYLNLRVAMQRMDPALEEVARSLGHGAPRRFTGVILPQLRPALLAGGLLVALHVIGDFGVVSLMRYETLTYALYQSYAFGDLNAAVWLAAMLVAVTGVLLAFELRFLRRLRLDPVGVTTRRVSRRSQLGRAKGWAVAFLSLLAIIGLGIPVATILEWVVRAAGDAESSWREGWAALLGSVSVSLPAAIAATLLAVPIAFLARRYPSTSTRLLEQSSYIGYAIPGLAFALGLVLLTLRYMPWAYQTMAVLIYAYALHFLAEAVGPVRSSLYTATPRLEEASRSLGRGRSQTFLRVTLPLLRPGIVASMAFVFLSAMKELPLTFILAPRDFTALAKRVWDHTNEADFAAAAPHALAILLVSTVFVGFLLRRSQADRD